jgi:hypothetical protein
MISFFVILFVLIVIYIFVSGDFLTEGFDPMNHMPSHTVHIPSNKVPVLVPPPPATTDTANKAITKTLTDSSNCNTMSGKAIVNPYLLPGDIPVAPYQQIGATNPLPYQDTSLIKANRQQLISLLELLKGFLAFEAQELSEKSDPTIQLPLATARSDFQVLQSEVSVLNRNPGVQSTITLSHLNDMNSNLAFLQQQVRLMGSAGTLQGPIYQFTEEGFQGSYTPKGPPATLENLEAFVARIQGEIIRLSASGTTDPTMVSRVAALTKMQNDVQTIIDQVNKGTLLSVEIPIRKDDIDKALPILGKPSEPLPQLLKAAKLPAGFANALPSNIQKDPDTMREISKLVDKYSDQIVKGITATFQVKYTPTESHQGTSTIDQTGFPSLNDLANVSNAKFSPHDSGAPVTDRLAALPAQAGRGPSHFDWKQRAKEIEAQIKKRGLKPTDFGIMQEGTKVSTDFSWKGYARMICTRLQATTDPSLPETCGCPPMNWKGWRISK